MIFMFLESTKVFLLTLLHSEGPTNPLKCMSYLPFYFSDEQFNLNGEKKFRVGGGGGVGNQDR